MKRYGVFAKSAALVTVEEEAGRLRIKPSRNGGSREGFVGLENAAVELPANSADLALAIGSVFDRCR